MAPEADLTFSMDATLLWRDDPPVWFGRRGGLAAHLKPMLASRHAHTADHAKQGGFLPAPQNSRSFETEFAAVIPPSAAQTSQPHPRASWRTLRASFTRRRPMDGHAA